MEKKLECPVCKYRILDIAQKHTAKAELQTASDNGDVFRKCDRCGNIISVSILTLKAEYG